MRFLVILTIGLCAGFNSYAQDSLLYLTKDEVVSIVKKYHPVVKQATIKVERAKAGITESRGAFDPVLKANLDRKTFDGDLYYSYFNPELSIPTWYGIELRAGAEEVVGSRYISERTFGKTSYAGVKVSVLDGLILDERRAVLKQSRIMRQLTEAEQRVTVNNILFEAVAAYWNWVQQYQLYQVYTDVVANNMERLKFVRLEYRQGNRPAIDTVEVKTQLQTYQLMQTEARMEFVNAGYELSNYLWLENNLPLEWSERVAPDSTAIKASYDVDNLPGLESLVAESLPDHPKLRALEHKVNFFEIDRRLKAQAILPKLDVKANLLNKGYDLPPELTTPFIQENYKLGIDFSMPLFFRKERGAYRSAKFKVMETIQERDYNTLQVENKIRSYYNEVLILKNQVELYEDAYNNYARMFRGEQTRFNIGEGTLFLVNTRETKLLEARRKLLELKTKWQKSYAGLLWAAALM